MTPNERMAQSLLVCAGIAEKKAQRLSLMLQAGYSGGDVDELRNQLAVERGIARSSRAAAARFRAEENPA